MKIQTCGIFLYNNPSYIASSTDCIATGKCHGKILIEIKCHYNIKDKTTADCVKEYQS